MSVIINAREEKKAGRGHQKGVLGLLQSEKDADVTVGI